jgi:hypothetical protein
LSPAGKLAGLFCVIFAAIHAIKVQKCNALVHFYHFILDLIDRLVEDQNIWRDEQKLHSPG